jgi:hypothetical protein
MAATKREPPDNGQVGPHRFHRVELFGHFHRPNFAQIPADTGRDR